LPKNQPVVRLNSLRFKDLMQDLVLIRRNEDKFEEKYRDRLTADQFDRLSAGLNNMFELVLDKGQTVIDLAADENGFIQEFYSNVLNPVENSGHMFGTKLSDREKNALIAFLATL
jgi:hypothetical protein